MGFLRQILPNQIGGNFLKQVIASLARASFVHNYILTISKFNLDFDCVCGFGGGVNSNFSKQTYDQVFTVVPDQTN